MKDLMAVDNNGKLSVRNPMKRIPTVMMNGLKSAVFSQTKIRSNYSAADFDSVVSSTRRCLRL